MALTMNQGLNVRSDVFGIVHDKREVSPEDVFEELQLRYTGVTLTDIRGILDELCRTSQLYKRGDRYLAVAWPRDEKLNDD